MESQISKGLTFGGHAKAGNLKLRFSILKKMQNHGGTWLIPRAGGSITQNNTNQCHSRLPMTANDTVRRDIY